MSISPYIHPQNLTSGIKNGSAVGGLLFGDSLDKRNSGIRSIISDLGTGIKEWAGEISNQLGSRAPMYTIGEISEFEDSNIGKSKWVPDEVKGLARAVYNITTGPEQYGVIIDGIGSISAEIAIDMPTNPFLYRSNMIADQRVRTPNTVKMQVFVSNYLNDDIIGNIADSLAGADPTGVLGQYKNVFLNGGNTRAQSALYKLRWLQENGKPFTLYTPHGIYHNMLIKSLHPVTNEKTMDMLYCEIEFREVIMYASLQTKFNSIPKRTNVQPTEAGWAQKWAAKL